MIVLRRIFSATDIKRVMTDPDVWPFVSEDGYSKEDYEPVEDESFRYLGIYSNGALAGLFFVHPDNGATSLKAHIAILKPFRSLYALPAVKRLIEWFCGLEERINKLNATIPEYNTGAARLAGSAGFSREGVNRKSIMKDGVFYDQFQFGITKEEAREICQQRYQ